MKTCKIKTETKKTMLRLYIQIYQLYLYHALILICLMSSKQGNRKPNDKIDGITLSF